MFWESPRKNASSKDILGKPFLGIYEPLHDILLTLKLKHSIIELTKVKQTICSYTH